MGWIHAGDEEILKHIKNEFQRALDEAFQRYVQDELVLSVKTVYGKSVVDSLDEAGLLEHRTTDSEVDGGE